MATTKSGESAVEQLAREQLRQIHERQRESERTSRELDEWRKDRDKTHPLDGYCGPDD
jgi:hypothetical protein